MIRCKPFIKAKLRKNVTDKHVDSLKCHNVVLRQSFLTWGDNVNKQSKIVK